LLHKNLTQVIQNENFSQASHETLSTYSLHAVVVKLVPSFYHLRQRGDVLPAFVCLSACLPVALLATSRKTTDLDEHFIRDIIHGQG